tara:strand:+ start:443 stop:814 length:372 start_codon:yes stop_codon:yes gene_type:complete
MTNILVIALGGAIGSVIRYLVANSVDLAPGKFPFLTLSINAIGSFLMGIAFVLLVEKNLFSSEIRDFVIIGFLSAFTTFSTFAFEVYFLFQNQNIMHALLYIMLSVVLCCLLLFLGIYFVRLI